jgi:hypothetical protein
MGISKETWKHLMSTRSDMSSYVTHLTREHGSDNPLDTLLKIIVDRKLIGSNNKGFIQGNDRAVCFQDAPLPGIVQNVYQNQVQESKIRYRGFGLMFSKDYVFKRGARPVIYETKQEAKEKFSSELWRVVTFDLNDDTNFIDWTHEREWRVKGDFEFELEEVIIVIPNYVAYQQLIEKVDTDILSRIQGIVQMAPINF